MNKEVKELIKEIKEFSIEYCHNPYYDYTLTKEEVELLLDYINQLEKENKQFQQANVEFVSQNNKLQHRIYEAIDYIKHSWWLRTDQTYDTSKDLQGWEVEELLSILERGKE